MLLLNSSHLCLIGVQADAYLYANPQRALGAVHFNTSNPQVC